MITRTFHPIGQGAFYSERHDNFNIVYDCGELGNEKLGEKVVKQAFEEGENIDILFISHFDADHVNKIEVLKEQCNIKKVILPLLHKEEKKLLMNLHTALGHASTSSLIRDHQDFFGENTKITMVRSIPEEGMKFNEDYIVKNNEKKISTHSLDKLPDKIDSKTILKQPNSRWIFIPYNFEYEERSEKLKQLLKQHKLDLHSLKNDVNYAIQNRSIIKSIYKKLSGGININSMVVYSGPNSKKGSIRNTFHNPINSRCLYKIFLNFSYYRKRVACVYKRVACIYTGDADLNVAKIKDIYKKHWNAVGTIQVPHHGSVGNFDKNIIKDNLYYCPISVGANTYGHPSSRVLADITSLRSFPVLVTNDLCSTFVQSIDFN
jgi:beta-lactamase superfamily II metal-dependent hydrolase